MTSAAPSSGLLNPYHYLHLAAAGNPHALLCLAQQCELRANEQRDLFAAMEGLSYARLAALGGGKDGLTVLVSIMGLAADLCGERLRLQQCQDAIVGELLAIASELADAGNEVAAETLNDMAALGSPEAVVAAKLHLAQMADARAELSALMGGVK